jgi:hypothetical protein
MCPIRAISQQSSSAVSCWLARSWVIAFAGTKATDANTKTLSSTTDEASTANALNVATGRGVTSWASRTYSAVVNTAGNRMDAVEVLVGGVSFERASQVVAEVVYSPDPKMRASQVVIEVVYKQLYIDLRTGTATGSSSGTAAMAGNLFGTADGSSSGVGTLTGTFPGGGARVQVVWVG